MSSYNNFSVNSTNVKSKNEEKINLRNFYNRVLDSVWIDMKRYKYFSLNEYLLVAFQKAKAELEICLKLYKNKMDINQFIKVYLPIILMQINDIKLVKDKKTDKYIKINQADNRWSYGFKVSDLVAVLFLNGDYSKLSNFLLYLLKSEILIILQDEFYTDLAIDEHNCLLQEYRHDMFFELNN